MSADSICKRLNALLTEAGLGALEVETSERFCLYLSLLIRWNSRLNLSAVREEEAILSRHFLESIACSRMLPAGISTLLDFGSGAGFPGLPIALCRPEISVTLAESQGKKAAFLQEAVRALSVNAVVHAGRAELLDSQFDCVILRAVERMAQAAKSAGRLVVPGGWLALMATRSDHSRFQSAAGEDFSWSEPIQLVGSEARVVALGRKRINASV